MREVALARPRGAGWLGMLLPSQFYLGRARHSRPGERVAMLVHGLGMNEDYFGLLAPEIIDRGYDVWALRLPGYTGRGEAPSWLPAGWPWSCELYAWVVAMASTWLHERLQPQRMIAWGHSLGARAFLEATPLWPRFGWTGPDEVVLEAPPFREALRLSGATMASFAFLPNQIIDDLARTGFLDDLATNAFAREQCLPIVPGRTSRLVFLANGASLVNPLAADPTPSSEWLRRLRVIAGTRDRLLDSDRLVALLDAWGLDPERRLILPRNHFLSLNSAPEIAEWVLGSGKPGLVERAEAETPSG